MRLVHLSDLHFGALNPELPAALLKAVECLRPDLVVISGDLSQRGTRLEFQAAKAFLDALITPYVVVPGNHDMPHGIRLWGRFKNTWRHFLKEIGIDLESAWQNEEMAVYGSNSAKPGGLYLDWSRGNLSSAQLDRIRQAFADVPENLLRVLVVHHPPAAPPSGTRRYLIDKRQPMLSALRDAGVDLILSGHFHVSYAVELPLPGTDEKSSVLSVVSTATSHRLKGEPNGFHLVEGSIKSLSVTPYAWTGAEFVRGKPWEFKSTANQHWKAVQG